MKLDNIHLLPLYAKAKIGFAESAANNPSLSMDELGIPWSSITTRERCVCVRFLGTDSESYIIETTLDLFSAGEKHIGWYRVHEDESETIVDDFLVFE
ncbi:MAG: hypothetical protein IPM25_14580 [Chloracidobacterium sp.]|nr:hypothetical protein [Chloracidobacterium sp.]